MSMQKYLPELLEAGVISEETAQRIEEYYAAKQTGSANRLFVVFGILGGILTGLGLILILAHNWDDFSVPVRTALAFLPLVIGQAACAYSILRNDATGWREGSAAFLFMAVGASISLVSQIYNIPGDLRSFLIWWMALSLPLMYVLRSGVASLLYVMGITWFVILTGYWSWWRSAYSPLIYWVMLAGALPFFVFLVKRRPSSNIAFLHYWFVPASLTIALGTLTKDHDELIYVGYFCLFGSFYLIGHLPRMLNMKAWANGFRVIGSAGTVVMLLMLSFEWYWRDLTRADFPLESITTSPEFFGTLFFVVTAVVALFYVMKSKRDDDLPPQWWVFIAFIIAFLLGLVVPVGMILVNIFTLAAGIMIIRKGGRVDHLGMLNYGLLVIALLVICRFFDTNLSFVVRGVLFIGVGAGFFIVNYRLLKRRKLNG